jgi:hypothetical protein
MGWVSNRIYLQFEDLFVKYAHVTEESNLIKISLDQASKSKSTEITIHERKIHLKDLWDEQQRRGVICLGDEPQRYLELSEEVGWENCCVPTLLLVEKPAYSAADRKPKGQNPRILDIPAAAKHGAEIELWFYPRNSTVVPRTGWASMVAVETSLGSVLLFAKVRPGLNPGISERLSQASDT